jgi:hypothetical protein
MIGWLCCSASLLVDADGSVSATAQVFPRTANTIAQAYIARWGGTVLRERYGERNRSSHSLIWWLQLVRWL